MEVTEVILKKSLQFLLDGSCTLGVQDFEGAKNNVLWVSTWRGQEVSYTDSNSNNVYFKLMENAMAHPSASRQTW